MRNKRKYRTRVDWWVWLCITVFFGLVVLAPLLSGAWIAEMAICLGSIVLFLILIFGSWYEIDGDQLIVYYFFRPMRFPISKIKAVKKTTGYLSTAGMSRKRVSIWFNDRSILKSSSPLEVSPKNREAFIARLKAVNPDITVE